jgi:hypothetical protein
MRFFVVVVAAAVSSAVAVASFRTFFPQQDAMMIAAVRSAAADMSRFRLSDLNPLQWAYNQVASEIASPGPNAALNFQATPVAIGEIKMPTPVGIDVSGGLAMRNGSLPRLHGTTARCSRGGVTIPCN